MIQILNFSIKITLRKSHQNFFYNHVTWDCKICQLCHTDVEDEFHFLMNCDKLIHERVTLFRNISDIVPSFTTMSDVEKFMFYLLGPKGCNLQ